MCNLFISTSAFCLWDIGPARKLSICESLGFNRVVIAFSTLKMLRQFASSHELCEKLKSFEQVMIHAPWCGVNYNNNKSTDEVFGYLNIIVKEVQIEAVIFHFDCISDWSVFDKCHFPYYIKNPNHASWDMFDQALDRHAFNSVLDVNRAKRFEDYMDKYINQYGDYIKAIHVSGFIDDLGRTPIVESGQVDILDKVKQVNAPIIIEGLFSPGDFQGIREEIRAIQDRLIV